MTDLVDRARAWMEADPDPAAREELQAVIDSGDEAELSERMDGTLQFGTAGIRGEVAAGSNRMNRAVVIRTTRGLVDYLLDRHDHVPPEEPVVVGFDGRLSSHQFAEDTIGVLAAAGFRVRYFPEVTPTPIVAYAGRTHNAIASIVITASHNPPQDNGYKVFDWNGAQIIPPVDLRIAEAIDRVGPANEVPRIDHVLTQGHLLVEAIEWHTFDEYWADVAKVRPELDCPRDLAIVYTPMHGVGGRYVEAVMSHAGYTEFHSVPAQAEPDGYFPTVPFPNPEEPGALDLAIELAEQTDADLLLANDPDADRLAVGYPTPHGWQTLTGNEIGCLMADYLLNYYDGVEQPIVINSIVSTPMLGHIAGAHGAHFEQTLTGFKWIANAAMDLEAAGRGVFVFGFEEAIGYSVGPVVRDKDGISAAVVFADMVSCDRSHGISITERLDRLAHAHGLWVSTQKSVVRPGLAGRDEIDGAMAKLATSQPRHLGDVPVMYVTDYRVGADERPRWLPGASLVAFDMENGARVLVRPSGTEPKLKIYVDLPTDLTLDYASTKQSALEQAGVLAEELAEWLGF